MWLARSFSSSAASASFSARTLSPLAPQIGLSDSRIHFAGFFGGGRLAVPLRFFLLLTGLELFEFGGQSLVLLASRIALGEGFLVLARADR